MTPVDGLLTVDVPADARVFVNGKLTTSQGLSRQYVSRNLQDGFNYTYEVKAQVVRGGEVVEETRTVDLRAGEVSKLAFDFAPAKSVETALTVKVPADAKVYLAGNPTASTGEVRVYRTSSLKEGSGWNDYIVKVEINRGGRTLVKEEVVNLAAGDTKEISFDFEGEQIASNR